MELWHWFCAHFTFQNTANEGFGNLCTKSLCKRGFDVQTRTRVRGQTFKLLLNPCHGAEPPAAEPLKLLLNPYHGAEPLGVANRFAAAERKWLAPCSGPTCQIELWPWSCAHFTCQNMANEASRTQESDRL